MEATISIPSHCMVTIRRPNGEIETMNYTAATKGQVVEMSPKTMEFVNGLMEKAGRGRIVDYENVSKEVPRPEKSKADIAYDKMIDERIAVMRASAGGERWS